MDPRHIPNGQFEYLVQDTSVERWLRFKEPWTRYLYSSTLKHFIEDLAGPQLGLKDPSSLVAWAKSRTDNIEVQDVIEKFAESQPATARVVRMSIVRSFLKRNGVALPSMGSLRQFRKDFHRGYTREEVQTLLGFLDDQMQKLYVLFAKDTGLRAQDLLSLKYRHVKKDLEGGKDIVHLYLEPAYYNRRKASGLTFIGPNTVKLLKQLIEEKRVETRTESNIFPFSYPTIAESLLIAKRKASLDPLIQPNHGFRKFFENCLDRTGMDHHMKLRLEGHSAGTRDAYTSRDVEELRELYRNAYQFLDLSEEAAAESRVRDLEKIVAEQRQHIEALKAESSRQGSLVQLLQEIGPDGIRVLEQLIKEKMGKK